MPQSGIIADAPTSGQQLPDRVHRLYVRLLSIVAAGICMLAGIATGATDREALTAWAPSRNVELIYTGGPGSGPDLLARTIQSVWQANRMLGIPVTLVNKPGGNFSIAWNHLNQHPADGHYLMMASLSFLTSSASGVNSINYADATLIAQLFSEYIVFAVRADAPFSTGAEIATQLRRDPVSLTFASGGDGNGGANHLAAVQAMRAAGVDIRKLKVVQFRSSAEAATAVLGGHVNIIASPPAAVLQYANTGALRLIAISAPARSWGALARVPTWRELGINAVFSNSRAVVGAPGLSPNQIQYWEEKFFRMTKTEQWQTSLVDNNRSPAFLRHDECRRAWQAQYTEVKLLLGELGLAETRE